MQQSAKKVTAQMILAQQVALGEGAFEPVGGGGHIRIVQGQNGRQQHHYKDRRQHHRTYRG